MVAAKLQLGALEPPEKCPPGGMLSYPAIVGAASPSFSVPELTSTEPSLCKLVAMSVMSVSEGLFEGAGVLEVGLGSEGVEMMSESPLISKVPEFSIAAPLPLFMEPTSHRSPHRHSPEHDCMESFPVVPEIVSLPLDSSRWQPRSGSCRCPSWSRQTRWRCHRRGSPLDAAQRATGEIQLQRVCRRVEVHYVSVSLHRRSGWSRHAVALHAYGRGAVGNSRCPSQRR